MWSNTISAIAGCSLALDRAGGETGDDPSLEEEDEHDDGDGDDDRGGRDRADRGLERRASGEEADGGRNGAGPGGRGEGDGEQEVVPAEDEHEDGGGEHARRGEGCDHP